MLLRTRDLETLPDILLQLPDVHTLRTFGIVDKFRADASCLTLRFREEILLSWIGSAGQISIKAVIKAGTIVVIVMEELGIEGDRAIIFT
jgi:hypothetical protein